MSKELVSGIELAYAERTDLIVFALTGRTGSGCSTAAGLLCKTFDDITLSDEELDEPEQRKFAITKDFVRKQWIPFTTITVSSVIYSFVLEEDWEGVEKILLELKLTSAALDEFRKHLESLKQDSRVAVFKRAMQVDAIDDDRATGWQFFTESIDAKAKALRKEMGPRELAPPI